MKNLYPNNVSIFYKPGKNAGEQKNAGFIFTLFICLTLIPFSVFSSLSGTYTIGGSSPSYSTFTAAVNALNSQGVSGVVIFSVQPGTYTEQITIDGVSGASSTNLVTFESSTGNAGDVTLTYAASSSSNNWVVNLSGCSYVVFNNMTIAPTGTSYSNGIILTNSSTYDKFTNLIVTGPTVTSAGYNQALINLTEDGSCTGYCGVYNCTFNNDCYGVYNNFGYSCGQSYNYGMVVENNTFVNQYAGGISENRCLQGASIEFNNITSNSGYTSYEAIYVNIQEDTVCGNVITNCPGTGIYFANCSPFIFNNQIEIVGSATNYGIEFDWDNYCGDYIFITSNTVLVLNTNSQSAAFYLPWPGYDWNFPFNNLTDNVFINRGGGYAIYIANNGSLTSSNPYGGSVAMDYNDYYTTGPYIGAWGSNSSITNATTFSNWQSTVSSCGCGADAHSKNINPSFVSDINLNLTADDLRYGEQTAFQAAWPTDINGKTRGTTPDMGAAEFSGPSLVGDTTPCTSSSTLYTTDAGKSNYVWSVTGGTIVSGGTSTSDTARVTWTGTGTVSVSYTGSGSSASLSVSPVSCTVISISTSTSDASNNCNASDGSLTINASGGNGGSTYYFSISGPQSASAYGSSPHTFTGLKAGNYSITVYDAGEGGAPSLDQYYPANYGNNGEGPWGDPSQSESEYQPFTPSHNGLLTEIDFGLTTRPVPTSSASYSGTGILSVYEGSGTSGTLLTSQTVTASYNYNSTSAPYYIGMNNFTLSSPVSVVGGQVYTFSFASTSSGLDNMWLASGNGGEMSGVGLCELCWIYGCNPFGDAWVFNTYLSTASPLSDGYQGTGSATVSPNETCGPISANVSASSNASTDCSDDGSVTISATGGDYLNSYYFVFSSGPVTPTGYGNGNPGTIFNGLPAGSYTVNVYDASSPGGADGWSTSVSFSIGSNNSDCGTAISASAMSTTDASTACSQDGAITVTASGGDGTGNYYFAWSGPESGSANGQSGYVISGLSYGTYNITVYNASSPDGYDQEESTTSAYVVDDNPYCPSPISAYINSSSDETCPGSSDGSLTVYASGGDGTTNYYFTAYNGYNGQTYTSGNSGGSNYITLSGIPAGDYYYITVYDATNPSDGWAYSFDPFYNVDDNYPFCPGPISASISSSTNETCPGSDDGSITLSVTGGDGSQNYYAVAYLYGGEQFQSPNSNGSSTVTISGLTAGDYYYIYIYDANNPGDGYADYTYPYYSIGDNNSSCGGPISAYVSSSSNESCPGSSDGSITLYVSGGDGNNYYYAVAYDYGGTPYQSSNQNGPYITISGLPAGDYYYIYIYDADNPSDGYADYTYPYYSIGDNSGSCGSSGSPIGAYVSSTSNETCPGSDDGSMTVYAYNGDGNTNYYFQAYNGNTGQWYTSGNSNGSNYITLSGIPAGDYYYVYVYDADNPGDGYADYMYPYTEIYDNSSSCGSPISAYVSGSSNESCPGSDDGSITVYASGGDGSQNYYAVAYLWGGTPYQSGNSYGSNYITISGLPSGDYYYVYVYDANNPGDGYADYLYPYVYIYDNSGSCNYGSPISAYVSSSSNESCPGSDDGSITVYASGGDGSNNYFIQAYNAYNGQWYTSGDSYGSNYITVGGLTYGYYYYVYVYDAANSGDGYADYMSPYIFIYDNSGSCGSSGSQINAYISSSSNESCPGANDGSITIYASGGDGSNNYYVQMYDESNGQWYYASPGGGNNYITIGGLSAGTYAYLYVYDASNTGDGYADYTYPYYGLGDNSGSCGSPISSYIYTSQNESCPGADDGSIGIYASGGDGSNNYYAVAYLYGGTAYQSANSNGSNYFTISGLPAGDYYYIYVYDANNPGDGLADYTYPYYSIGDNSGSCGSAISAYVSSSGNESCPGANDGYITIYASGGDGSNNYYISAYNSDGNWYTSGASNGSNYITVNVPAGYYYYIDVYDNNNPNDGFSTQVGWYGYIYDNNSSCGSGISAYVSSSTNETCPGSDDGSITMYASGGDGSTNYYAVAYLYGSTAYQSGNSNGSNYITISGLTAGDYYYIYVYDAANPNDGFADYTYPYYSIGDNNSVCTSPISAYYVTSSNASNACSSDGSILVYASGGDGSTNYIAGAYDDNTGQWYYSSASVGSNYVGISVPAGYYSEITVNDANNPGDGLGYTFYPGITVGENSSYCPTPISFTVTSINNASDLCPGTMDGAMTVTISGGNGTSTYVAVAWLNGSPYYSTSNPGSSTLTIPGLQAGAYTPVSVYDADGSNSPIADGLQDIDNSTYTVGANINGCPIVAEWSTYTSASTPCTSDGSITMLVFYGDGSGNYVVDAYLNGSNTPTATGSGSGSSAGTYITISGLAAGNYVFDVFNAASPDGSDGMEGSFDFTLGTVVGTCGTQITVNATPANLSGCNTNDGSITVTPDGGDGSNLYNIYLYNSSNTLVNSSLDVASADFTGLSPDIYSVSVEDNDNPTDGNANTETGLTVNNGTCGTQITVNATPTNLSGCNTNDGSVAVDPTGGDGTDLYNIYLYNSSNTLVNSSLDVASVDFTSLSPDTYSVSVEDNDNPTDGFANTQSGVTVNNGDCSGPNTWTGNGSANDWNDPLNWSQNVVPNGCAANVSIPSTGTNNDPVLRSNESVGNLSLGSGASITVDPGVDLDVCGNITGAGSGSDGDILGGGQLILNGTTQQQISGKVEVQSVQINNTAGVQLQSGSELDIYSELDLVAGQFDASNGSAILMSTSVTQAAIINNFGTNYAGTYKGKVNAQRYYGAPGAADDFSQHMLGSPVSGLNLSALGSTNATSGYYEAATGGIHNCNELVGETGTPYGNVFSYDETHASGCVMDGWKVGASSTATNAGTGYSVVLGTSSGTLTLSGPPNLGPSYSVATSNSGYANTTSDQGRVYTSGINLVSNPYPASLDPASLIADNPGYSAAVYVWNEASASYYQPTTIAPFQAFKVIQTTQGAGNYVINGTSRTTGAGTFQRTANPMELNMAVTNTATGLSDETTVGFNPNSTAQFNPAYDLIKLPGSLTRHTLYSVNSSDWLWVNILQSIEQTSTVPVGFEPGASGTYTADFTGIGSFDPTSYITLEDTKTGTFHDVRSGDYTFTSDAANDNWNRFVLHFTPPASINTTAASCDAQGIINVTQPGTANWTYTMVDANNTILSSGTLNVNSPLSASVAAGVYTLTLKDNNGYTVVKTIQVNGVQPVVASFNASANSIPVNEEVTLNSTSTGAVLYNWNFGDGTTNNGATVSHAYTTEGVYNITLNTTSTSGCTSSASQTITVTQSITGVTDLSNTGNILIWSNENIVNIDFSQLKDVQANIEIYNILGQKLVDDKYVTSAVYRKEIPNIEEGYIVVSVKNNDAVITKKLFISNVK